MILIHSRESILNELDQGLAKFAQQKLQERGVECRLRTTVKEITPNGAWLSTGEQVPARTVICSAGILPILS